MARDEGLRDPGLLLMLSLAGGPKHGYGMMEDVESFSGVRLGPGTLYGALERLERDGLVEPLESNERKRPYRLTETGDRLLRGQLQTVRQLLAVGRERLAPR
jgi:DNA-binding PadR family transcriptional regulator